MPSDFRLSLDECRNIFFQTYIYFYRQGAFEFAYNGATRGGKQLSPPTMAPDPKSFLTLQLQDRNTWPIDEKYTSYDEKTMFTIIEILYDHIGIYDMECQTFENSEWKKQFVEKVNGFLKFYSSGYYLEPKEGFIMELPNLPLQKQLQSNVDSIPDDILERMGSATKQFYKYDSDMENKRKSINSLADILERIRNHLKEIFNGEYQIPKNAHDKLIFDIVNNYQIRHDNAKQKDEYSRDIWYEWMMQYYTSTIIAYYKLQVKYSTKKGC